MTRAMPHDAVEEEIREAVRREGRRPRCVRLLRAPDPRKRGRSTWRVELQAGGAWKARRLETAEAAQDLAERRRGLEEAFVPVLARHGPVLLEPWVEGRPLDERQARPHVTEAGALLGRLHRVVRPGTGGEAPTAPWRARALADLETLAAASALRPEEAAALGARLRREDPGRGPAVLVHWDLCAENLLVDAAGRLRVVDNEWFSIDAAGLDLGRTLHRWPLAGDARAEFLRAYGDAFGADPGPLGFWELVAILWSARVRLDDPPERRAVPLAAARRLAAAGSRRARGPQE